MLFKKSKKLEAILMNYLSILFGIFIIFESTVFAVVSSCPTIWPTSGDCSAGKSRVIYVAAACGVDDNGAGDSSNPFKTIQYALGKIIGGRSKVCIANGHYDEDIRGRYFPDNISQIEVIGVTASNGDRVVVMPTQAKLSNKDIPETFYDVYPVSFSNISDLRNNIKFRNIVFDGRYTKGAVVAFARSENEKACDLPKVVTDARPSDCIVNPSNIRFIDSTLRFGYHDGAQGGCDKCHFENLLIHDNGTVDGTHGLYLHNDIYEDNGTPNGHYHGVGITISGCTIFNNFHEGIRDGGMKNVIIQDNHVFHNGYPENRGSPAVEAQSTNSQILRNKIEQNLGFGLRVSKTSTVEGNSFSLNPSGGIITLYDSFSKKDFDQSGRTYMAEVKNNTFYNNGDSAIKDYGQQGYTPTPGPSPMPKLGSYYSGNKAYSNQCYRMRGGSYSWKNCAPNEDYTAGLFAGLPISPSLKDPGLNRTFSAPPSSFTPPGPLPKQLTSNAADFGIIRVAGDKTYKNFSVRIEDPGPTIQSVVWKAVTEPSPGSAIINTIGLDAGVEFLNPGAYNIRAIATLSDGSLTSKLFRGNVYANILPTTGPALPAGTFRIEGEELHPNRYLPVDRSAMGGNMDLASGKKILEEFLNGGFQSATSVNNTQIFGILPSQMVSGQYNIKIGYFDRKGIATSRLYFTTPTAVSFPGSGRDRDFLIKYNDCDDTCSVVKYIKKPLATGVTLNPGDRFDFDGNNTRSDITFDATGGLINKDVFNIDYIQFEPVVQPSPTPTP